ncbi:hypothetical protein PG991_015404 [Apiospora marii]|uniref:NB-ARC domain-containing protein n=1 Tax=Apiospora marii TaxID=335849 RepID=A0ABR1R1I8_9PEZI
MWQKGQGVMEALERGNLFEDVLMEHRRHQLPDYDIVSFWGASDTVVPRESSRLYLSGRNENVVMLNADHGGVCKFDDSQESLDNLDIVRFNISEVYTKALKKHRAPQHHIPLPRNKRFVGRSGFLEDMKQKLLLDEDEDCQNLAISGLGGIGKTQLALQFAYWVKENEPDFSVFWVPVSSRESFEHECAKIGRKFGFLKGGNNDNEDPKEPFRNYLESAESGDWLLIVDNADDENVVVNPSGGIRNYLPNSDTGLTIYTTRTRDIADELGDHVIELPQMSNEDAVGMLQTSLPRKERYDLVAELAEELTYLPLAISQATAYMKRNRIGIQDYLVLFRSEESLVDLMQTGQNDKTRYPGSENALALTWSISFSQIVRKDPVAARLLTFISFIEPKAIPRSLLPSLGSDAVMENAIGTLIAYAFLACQEDNEIEDDPISDDESVTFDFVTDEMEIDQTQYGQTRDDQIQEEEPDDVSMQDEEALDLSLYQDVLYDMHSLVHFAVKRLRPVDELIMAQTLQRFEMAWDADSEYLWRLYLPHTLRLLEQSGRYGDYKAKFDLCFRVGKCLSLDHRFHMAIGYFEEVLKQEDVAVKYGNYTPDDSLLFALGNAYLVVGRTVDSIPLLKAVVHTQREHHGRASPGCQRCERALASAYIDVGETREATAILEYIEMLQSRHPALKPNDPRRLETDFLLGRARLRGGRTGEAIKLLEQTVSAYTSLNYHDVYDEYVTNRLMAQHWLAAAYKEQGNVPRALDILQPVVDTHRKLSEKEDPYRLLSEELLSELLMETCRTRGMELRKQVVAARAELAERYPVQPRSLGFYCLEEFKAPSVVDI